MIISETSEFDVQPIVKQLRKELYGIISDIIAQKLGGVQQRSSILDLGIEQAVRILMDLLGTADPQKVRMMTSLQEGEALYKGIFDDISTAYNMPFLYRVNTSVAIWGMSENRIRETVVKEAIQSFGSGMEEKSRGLISRAKEFFGM